MTTLCPQLDGSRALLAELAAELHGDPRYSAPAGPSPRAMQRVLDITHDIHHAARLEALEKDQP